MSESKVLIVDDERDMLEVCSDSLRSLSHVSIVTEDSGQSAVDRLKTEAFDVLVVDRRMPGVDGLNVLAHAIREQPGIEVLLITAFPTIGTAVEAIKKGAADYLVKPFAPSELRQKVKAALERRLVRTSGSSETGTTRRCFDGIIGDSCTMRKLFRAVKQVAPSPSSVLILGESGTGKELVARSIHSRSGRPGRFVPVDCGAISASLLESEFFGHEKGAFTGASGSRTGLLEFAEGGTIFLDEVCEMAPNLQAKLLRALQERCFRRVGGDREIRVDVRVVAATNRDIEEEVREGRFRQDLYYRINVVKLKVPPLRERREDIPLLLEHFTELFAREEQRVIRGIDREVTAALVEYAWPGNVRELQNAIRSAVTMVRGDRVSTDDLPDEIVGTGEPGAATDFVGARSGRVEHFERDYFTDLLRQVGGDIVEASKLASVPRSTLYRILKRHSIHPADFRSR